MNVNIGAEINTVKNAKSVSKFKSFFIRKLPTINNTNIDIERYLRILLSAQVNICLCFVLR